MRLQAVRSVASDGKFYQLTPDIENTVCNIKIPGWSSSDIEPKLKSSLEAIEKWLETKILSCNTSKTCYMRVGSRQNVIESKDRTLGIYDKSVEKKTTTNLLEDFIDETISWDNQTSHIITKVQNGLRMLYNITSLSLQQQQQQQQHKVYLHDYNYVVTVLQKF